MKTNQFFFAAFCMFLLGNFTQVKAQKINFWKGGAPGQESNWNCPKNWSEHQIPDAFQNVIVPDVSSGSGVYPTIDVSGLEVNALVLESGATLTITKKGALEVITTFDEYGASEKDVNGTLYVPSMRYAGDMKIMERADIAALCSN
ncbi:MAG: hypothetical protein K9J37_15645 [Saprospiraceae bacterium]|nr:hypothetical protein [Saprospiraceae bacterium]MCF8251345.1 hypothetical protein [Saprospiraceae bacterium]MCF8280520.1 hypothetical protein [Bacteroidales bacterium]MCF8313262.1 hypothetical protein [Saprospiraceae bacterium]MCF8441709.1 hypothetical protein [Saprospiraceae bacterium]